MPEWEHDSLADDLAGHLKAPDRMVWTDIQLGPQGSPRPDVYTINKSFVNPRPTAYECKISVSDFRSDVTSGKWSSYLEYAHSVVFAAPVGLLKPADIPSMCGLMVRHDKAWRYAKRPTVNPRAIAQEALIKLLIDGVNREGPKWRAQKWNDWDATAKFAKKFGAEASRYVTDAASTHRVIEHAQLQAARIVETAEQRAKAMTQLAEQLAPEKWAEVCAVLSVPPTSTKWAVESAIRELRANHEGTREIRALRQVISSMTRLVDMHKHLVEEKESYAEE